MHLQNCFLFFRFLAAVFFFWCPGLSVVHAGTAESSVLQRYQAYDSLCQRFAGQGLYPLELEHRFRMMEMLDSGLVIRSAPSGILKDYASLYVTTGLCYFNMDNPEKALHWFGKSLEMVEKIAKEDPDYPSGKRRLTLFANMGSAYLSAYRFKEAEQYFDKALEISLKLGDPVSDASLYNNLGIVYKEKKDFDRAFEYYAKALKIRTFLRDTAAMAQTGNNLGDAYFLTGNYAAAIEILDKALKMSRAVGNLRSQMKAANFLSLAFEKTGRFPEALEMQRLHQKLHDSIIGNEEVQKASRLELKYQYDKQNREQEYRQALLIGAKERKTIRYMVISAVLLLVTALLVLLYRNQRMRIRHTAIQQESLELEHRNLQLEKQQLAMELDHRNRELHTYVMYLLQKNEFIMRMIEKLHEVRRTRLKATDESWYREWLREMQSNVDNTLWNEFEVRFQQVHQDFNHKLLEKFPDLTPNELKLCAFLKLNMTSKDISAITFQSVKSIEVARNRMRKKMGILQNESLVTLLQML